MTTHRPALGTTTRDNAIETGRTGDSIGFRMARTADECECCRRALVFDATPDSDYGEWRPIAASDVFLMPLPGDMLVQS